MLTKKVKAVIGVGSNIDPEKNVKNAEKEVGSLGELVAKSTFRYTKPLLFKNQADFLNGAFLIRTSLSLNELRSSLKESEQKLGRVRTENKNGPRTIDLDVVVYDGEITDSDLYKRDFLRDSVYELIPDINIQ